MAKFCSNCGAELEEGSKFCDSCGAKVEEEQQELAVAPLPSMQTAPNKSAKSSKTTIQIFRKWRFVGFIFADNIYIDGIKVGKVSNGEASSIIEVTPGIHQIQLKKNYSFLAGFLRSRPTDFRIEEGEALKFNSDFNFGTLSTIFGFWTFKSLFSGFKVIKVEQQN